MVEHAWRNEANGRGALGRYLERQMLGCEAARALRKRLGITRNVLALLLERRRDLGWATTILDVAGGSGPHLREFVSLHGGPDLVVACHDRNPRSVTLGRQNAEREGLSRITFSVGDATDQASYLTRRDPDIVVAIDLLSWLPSDADARLVLRFAFERLNPQGCFLCSTQTAPPGGTRCWNSNYATPASALRSVGTIETWMAEAGFEQIESRPLDAGSELVIGWKPLPPAGRDSDAP